MGAAVINSDYQKWWRAHTHTASQAGYKERYRQALRETVRKSQIGERNRLRPRRWSLLLKGDDGGAAMEFGM